MPQAANSSLSAFPTGWNSPLVKPHLSYHIMTLYLPERESEMRDIANLEKIAAAISDELKTRYANVEIVDVDVSFDNDSDGDDILLVKVIFASEFKAAENGIFSDAVRAVRGKLAEMNESAFPLMSFISSKEMGPKFAAA